MIGYEKLACLVVDGELDPFDGKYLTRERNRGHILRLDASDIKCKERWESVHQKHSKFIGALSSHRLQAMYCHDNSVAYRIGGIKGKFII